MKARTLTILGTIGAVMCAPAALGQSMVGQAHDFSGFAWAGNEICKPCHTPHNAIADETGNSVGWLWDHELTTATYNQYDNTSAPAGPDDGVTQAAFDKLSRLCMGCHDGTVAVDSFGGASGTVFIGSINPDLDVGIDLSNDHPVGLTAIYPEAGDSKFNAADANHALGPAGQLKLREMYIGATLDYVVGCMTCHTPHYKGFPKQLRMTNSASAMCLSCHIK